jgi:hypothetical protein
MERVHGEPPSHMETTMNGIGDYIIHGLSEVIQTPYKFGPHDCTIIRSHSLGRILSNDEIRALGLQTMVDMLSHLEVGILPAQDEEEEPSFIFGGTPASPEELSALGLIQIIRMLIDEGMVVVREPDGRHRIMSEYWNECRIEWDDGDR